MNYAAGNIPEEIFSAGVNLYYPMTAKSYQSK